MISWTVYVDHINANNRIAKHNVFDHAGFFEDCQKNYKKNKEDKELFFEQLRRDLFYWYGSKCEWEVVVTPLFSRCECDGMKIDVNQQVRLNWDQFCDYVWENRGVFKVEEKKEHRREKRIQR